MIYRIEFEFKSIDSGPWCEMYIDKEVDHEMKEDEVYKILYKICKIDWPLWDYRLKKYYLM